MQGIRSLIATRDTDSLPFVVSICALYRIKVKARMPMMLRTCCRAQRMQQGMVKNPDIVIHESRRRGTSKASFMRRFHHSQALKQVR
ncbi:hypothetical protein K469DRAFT_720714 [Zopfia rhizophila CBS 207.26]|uniref:Uncharacterized protein n=1 Tax=Zopfia rhizophila CBS 207.26 TaxID=1314779 RepID=A0A6A6DCX1_9PEZI|nr:hypothetical protein K469DRAFT_720714 [Zopfia rhizophila CBS 207.26]